MFRIRRSFQSVSTRQILTRAKRNYTSDANVANRNRFYFVLIPKIGVTIGCLALCFQVGVLYPWHIELSKEFKALEIVTKRIADNELNLATKLDSMMEKDEDCVKDDNMSILEVEQKILSKLDMIDGLVLNRKGSC